MFLYFCLHLAWCWNITWYIMRWNFINCVEGTIWLAHESYRQAGMGLLVIYPSSILFLIKAELLRWVSMHLSTLRLDRAVRYLSLLLEEIMNECFSIIFMRYSTEFRVHVLQVPGSTEWLHYYHALELWLGLPLGTRRMDYSGLWLWLHETCQCFMLTEGKICYLKFWSERG